MEKDTIFVNLISGPGAGKSTTAAKVFGMLKDAGISCELIREWVKDYVWEDNQCVLTDELKIFAEQNHLQHRLKGKVDVVITDAPLCLKLFYQPKEYDLTNLVLQVMDQYNNFNVFLIRKKKYDPAGRQQSEQQARNVDKELSEIMVKYDIPFIVAEGTTAGAEWIYEQILYKLSTR